MEAVPQARRRAIDIGLLVTVIVLALVYVGLHIADLFFPIERVPWLILVPAYAALGFAHATYTLGHRRALTLLGITVAVTFLAELIGVRTGLVFGNYHYTDVLRPQVLGIPVIVPFAYFMVAYPSYYIANLIADGRPVAEPVGTLWIFWVSLLSASCMTAWDLTMDPLMSGGQGAAWIWEDGGAYFGVPLHNFMGWFGTTATINLLFRFSERRIRVESYTHHGHYLFQLIPVASYGALGLLDTYIGGPIEVRLVSPFLIGIPVIAAVLQIYLTRARLGSRPEVA